MAKYTAMDYGTGQTSLFLVFVRALEALHLGSIFKDFRVLGNMDLL